MFREDQRADPAHVWRREAVARGADLRAADPRDFDVDAAREKLDRRRGVVEESERILVLVTADRDHRGETPWVALDRHVVGRGDEHAAPEVGAVRELVKKAG